MAAIKARKIEVEADSIVKSKSPKHHQTHTHNAQSHIATKNVDVKIMEQYPTRDNNSERPRSGTVLHGQHAIISSRKTSYLGPSDKSKRTRGVFRDDVTVSLRAPSKNSKTTAAKSGRGGKKTSRR